MASSPSTGDDQLAPGERVLKQGLRVEITDPNDSLTYLFVLIDVCESQALATATGFDVVSGFNHTPPDELGVIARWMDLEAHGLLDRTDEPTALAAGVKRHRIPVMLRALSTLRSVEATLRAAEDTGMVYGEALALLLDYHATPPALAELSDWLTVHGYSVHYDPTTETLRVSRRGETCAVFADRSVVGEKQLRTALEECIDRLTDLLE